MQIALDYDGTITADPAFWREFVGLAKKHNHKIVIVTTRKKAPSFEHLPVVLANGRKKRDASHASQDEGNQVPHPPRAYFGLRQARQLFPAPNKYAEHGDDCDCVSHDYLLFVAGCATAV